MSIRVMELVWRAFHITDSSEVLALLALADWCNDDGGSLHPSVATVAKRIRKSVSQTRRVLHKLIDDGWLTVVGNAFGGAPGTSRQYRLNIAKLTETASADASPTASTHARGRTDARASTHARDGLHGCAQTASTHASQAVKKQPSITVKSKEQVRSRGSRLPTGWTLPDDWKAWAQSERHDLDIDAESAKFRDYWHAKAGKDGCKADWLATWRNWIRNAYAGKSASKPNPVRESLTDRAARLNREHDLQEVRHALAR